MIINFPSWLAPKRPSYALGHEGVLFWPDYVPPEMLLATHTGSFGDLSFIRDDATRPELADNFYGLTGPQPDWARLTAVPAQVLRTQYGEDGLALLPVGSVGPRQETDSAGLAAFHDEAQGAEVELLDARAAAVPGGVWVDLLWKTAVPPAQTTVFVHLVDAAGNLVAQADGDSLGGIYPFERWQPGAELHDRRWLAVGDAGGLSVRLGLYDRGSGQRLSAEGVDGTVWPDNALPLAIDRAE